jgi:hypothetical protein
VEVVLHKAYDVALRKCEFADLTDSKWQPVPIPRFGTEIPLAYDKFQRRLDRPMSLRIRVERDGAVSNTVEVILNPRTKTAQ